MFRRIGKEIWSFVFWTYERGGLRYDIMVGLILAFIFLTPRGWFKDRPAPPSQEQVTVLEAGSYRLDARLLTREEHSLEEGAKRVLKAFTGKTVKVTRLDPVLDSDGKVEAYHVWVEEHQ
jgi:hypothetical protein